MESINFVMALHKRINLVVYVLNVRECIETMDIIGLPMYIKETMKHLISDRARDDIPPENVQILVLHKDPGRYEYSKNMAYNDREPDYSIGRSMYETDRIPTDWIDICNSNIVCFIISKSKEYYNIIYYLSTIIFVLMNGLG